MQILASLPAVSLKTNIVVISPYSRPRHSYARLMKKSASRRYGFAALNGAGKKSAVMVRKAS